MKTTGVQRDFKNRVGAEISLLSDGPDRFRVVTPFWFDDGDGLVIVLKRETNRWILTDEAHTMFHLGYWVESADLYSENNLQAIDRIISSPGGERRDGELVLPVTGDEYGKALYSFIRALLKVIDLVLLPTEAGSKPSHDSSSGQAAA